ncbi:ammonium transporter [Coniophora puteana RWD-64-598 SS2]|uniref:Ammonium transporter n=1 Tax=Coniophora puteana (strain RWD-64-598) TaxID=741705 RepID=A0A5M3N4Y9_CONPW|nr:ammonium transporter [Coniophora puteana RWD-64-598 SS2]EIW86366.1 ammonium transporter [Coniophora puteana RWD-64-598 SS2]
MSAKRDSTQFDRGDLSFIIVAGAMVSFMIPGLAFLYSGLSRRKSALSLIWIVSASNAICIFQWYFWGYSLAFSPTATSGFIGNLDNFGLINVLDQPSPGSPLIPSLLYSFYQMEFACVTVAILVGGIAERGRVLPAAVFTFFWLTLVYCPLACWAWNSGGWGFTWGVLDYAGGGPVEIGSGVGGLAYAWVLGRRHEKELLNFRPHNVSMVNLGTFILWFGWLGFNAGSSFGANLRAVMAAWNSMLAAAFGGIVWCLLDYRLERKYSMVGFCSGTIAGLVAATPASGYIPPWAAIVMGIVTGAVCNYATKLKFLFRIDDALDLFAEHAVGGIIGLLMNGLFGSHTITALDGVNTSVLGGWIDHNWKQLYIQFAYVCAACSYTFVVTAIIAKIIDMIPGLHLRTPPEGESLGIDEVEIGEFANDYIEVRRDYKDWTPPSQDRFSTPSSEPASDSTVAAGDRHGQPDQAYKDRHALRPESNGLDTISEKPSENHEGHVAVEELS